MVPRSAPRQLRTWSDGQGFLFPWDASRASRLMGDVRDRLVGSGVPGFRLHYWRVHGGRAEGEAPGRARDVLVGDVAVASARRLAMIIVDFGGAVLDDL